MMSPVRNWAGNHLYRARRVLRPRSVEELQEMVRASDRIRALGTRHAFNDLADTDGDHVSLADLPRRLDVDTDRGTVTIDGGARYGDVCAAIHRAGFALHNLASLPHLSVAGAVATGTHGSGDALGNLSSAVVGLELVRSDGELERIGPGSAIPLDGAIVALGALGVVSALTLRLEPATDVAQVVFEGLSFATTVERFDEVSGAASSVSLFTDWTEPRFHQVWLKRRVGADGDERPEVLAEATAADGPRHPIRGMAADACTAQLGVAGPWHERLPHFRLDHVPSAGDEIQSEFFVDRRHAGAALSALAGIADRLAPLAWVTEIRTVAADRLWLSPAFDRPSAAIHFTWKRDEAAVDALLPVVEERLAPFAPRPHWGKRFTLPGPVVGAAYSRRPAFIALADALDPEHKLRNRFLDATVFGD
jgi:xylitol oxidase